MENINLIDTIERLEKLIERLEKNVGLPHKESPLKKSSSKPITNVVQKKDEQKKAKVDEINEKVATTDPKSNNEKKENKKKPETKQTVDPVIEDFTKCEFRIGDFIEVWKHPDSEKLYCEKIHIGKEVREIASGLQKHISLGEMKGRSVVFVNLKSKKLGGFPSHGMVMCCSDKTVEGEEKIEICRPGDNSEVGERIYLEGYEELFPDSTLEPCSSKVMERVLSQFKTDKDGNVTYNGIRVRTKSSHLKPSSIKNGMVS